MRTGRQVCPAGRHIDADLSVNTISGSTSTPPYFSNGLPNRGGNKFGGAVCPLTTGTGNDKAGGFVAPLALTTEHFAKLAAGRSIWWLLSIRYTGEYPSSSNTATSPVLQDMHVTSTGTSLFRIRFTTSGSDKVLQTHMVSMSGTAGVAALEPTTGQPHTSATWVDLGMIETTVGGARMNTEVQYFIQLTPDDQSGHTFPQNLSVAVRSFNSTTGAAVFPLTRFQHYSATSLLDRASAAMPTQPYTGSSGGPYWKLSLAKTEDPATGTGLSEAWYAGMIEGSLPASDGLITNTTTIASIMDNLWDQVPIPTQPLRSRRRRRARGLLE